MSNDADPNSSDPTDVEGLLEEIRIELNRRTGLFGSADDGKWSNDRAQKSQHSSPPRIEWVEDGGSIEDDTSNYTGGEDGDIGIDAVEFEVTIWAANKRECRKLRNQLYRAARATVDGPNLVFGSRYNWVPDANTHNGRKMTISITLRLPIKMEIEAGDDETGDYALVEMQSYETTVQESVVVANQAPTP
jgi:hypothetical protein